MKNVELKITNPESHFKKAIVNENRYSESEKSKLAKASKDFETMLTTMMIKSMTKTTDGLFGKDNYGGDVLDVLFETEMANHITNSKGMGIADKIYSSLTGEKLPAIQKNTDLSLRRDLPIRKSRLPESISTDKITPSNNAMKRLEKYEDIIDKASTKFNIDKKLIQSVILTESSARADATSKAKAKGLMQLMDSTATAMGVNDPWNPEENIHGGTKYLSKLLNMYDGNQDKALAAYNAGMGNVKKYNGIPPFKETQNYIKRVNNYLNNLD